MVIGNRVKLYLEDYKFQTWIFSPRRQGLL